MLITNMFTMLTRYRFVSTTGSMRTPLLYKRLGEIIKDHRSRLGLTQDQLSQHLGVSRASLANIETGRQKVLVHLLYRLADKLGVHATSLLPDPEEVEELEALDDLPISANVSLEQKRQIVRLLHGDERSSRSGGQNGQGRPGGKGKIPS